MRPKGWFLWLALLVPALAALAQAPESSRRQADELLRELVAQSLKGSPTEVSAKLEEAQELYRGSGDSQGEALVMVVRGLAAIASGEERRARVDLEAAMRRLEELDEPFAAAFVEVLSGMCERLMGRTERSLADLESAALGFGRIASSGRPASLEAFLRLGELFGAPVGQVEELKPMLAFVSPLLAQVMAGLVRVELAATLLDLGKLDEAEAQLSAARDSSRLLGGFFDDSSEAVWGELRRRQWRLDEAREHFVKAVSAVGNYQLVPFVKDRRMDVLALGRLVEIESLRGRFDAALEWSRKAQTLAKVDRDLARQASVLERRGELYLDFGRMGEGQAIFEEALELARQAGKPLVEASVEASLGALAFRLGLYEVAARHLEMSLLLLAGQNEPLLESSFGTFLAVIYLNLQADESSSSVLVRAEKSARESEWAPVESLVNIVKLLTGEPQGEGEPTKLGVELRNAADGPIGREAQGARALKALSALLGTDGGSKLPQYQPAAPLQAILSHMVRFQAALTSGDSARVRNGLKEALAAARGLGNADFEALCVAALAALDHREGRTAEALVSLRQAVETLEGLAEGIDATSLLSSYLGGRQILYQGLITLLTRQGLHEEAFSYSERARARALLRQLGPTRLGTPGSGSELVSQAEALRRAIAGWESELPNRHGPERQHLENDISHAKAEHEGLMIRVQVASPEYAGLVSSEPLDLAAVQSSLKSDETLVSYYLWENHLQAWLVGRDHLEHVELAWDEAARNDVVCLAAELGQTTRRVRGMEALDGCPSAENTSARLYTRLVAPLKSRIRSRRVILVPHGSLHYLPFAALKDPESGRYWIEDATLSYLPSASVLPLLSGKESSFEGRALVLGEPAAADPTLPPLLGAAREAREVAALWGVEPLLGAAATESRLHGLAGSFDVVHVAAHGLHNSRSSSFSRLALAPGEGQDGNLEVRELLSGVDFTGVNLVVLSGCETALGKRSPGDEVASLARAVLYAGSPAVVSSLWPVDDQATAELMTAFYTSLRAGQTASEALREAQLTLLRGGRFAEPSQWAAFTLTGEMATPVATTRGATSGGPGNPRSARGVEKRALLVGVAEYPSGSGWEPTSAGRDLVMIRATLERQGFAPERISELRDREATRAGIVATFERKLLEGSRPGDLVLLFFAGHGRQLTDREPFDELDGYDEALAPFDAPGEPRSDEGIEFYLRDDALRELLERLRRKLGPTGEVVVLLDSCYSGTGVRGERPERGAPPLGPPRLGRLEREEDTGSGFFDDTRGAAASADGLAPLVLISAARADEKAVEIELKNGQWAGSLSWSFSQAMGRVPPPPSYSGLAERMRSLTTGVVPNVPQAEGAIERPLLLGAAVEQTPYFAVTPVYREPLQVSLSPGSLAGLLPGAEVEIHREGTTTPSAATRLVSGRVVAASPFEARVELRSPVPAEGLSSARAVVTHQPLGPRQLPVALAEDLRLRLQSELRTWQESQEAIRWMKSAAAHFLRPCLDESPPELCVELMALPRNEVLWREEGTSWTELAPRLSRRLRRQAIRQSLAELDLFSPEVHVELEVVPIELVDCVDPRSPDRASCRVEELPRGSSQSAGGELELAVGSYFELRVKSGPASAFVSVLDLMPDGSITVLWPLPGSREPFRAPAGSVRVIDEAFRVKRPLGVDVFLLVASSEPMDFSPLSSLSRGELSRSELARLGPLAMLFEAQWFARGDTPALLPVAVSTSRRLVRIVATPKVTGSVSIETKTPLPWRLDEQTLSTRMDRYDVFGRDLGRCAAAHQPRGKRRRLRRLRHLWRLHRGDGAGAGGDLRPEHRLVGVGGARCQSPRHGQLRFVDDPGASDQLHRLGDLPVFAAPG